MHTLALVNVGLIVTLVHSLDMFGVLLANHQEKLHECSCGDYFVLKLIISSRQEDISTTP
jgi:hypothetical protein